MHYLSINSHAFKARRELSAMEVAGPRRLRLAAIKVPATMAMVERICTGSVKGWFPAGHGIGVPCN
ncbi:hypothetical protein CASFOL_024240 [Castilleja foliolosa]|uniref:Uncharacterized protein n=1 Tax=Castilleja foliolosa TaxID=1961234 RepID=A0ABD3CQS3_9LAMI